MPPPTAAPRITQEVTHSTPISLHPSLVITVEASFDLKAPEMEVDQLRTAIGEQMAVSSQFRMMFWVAAADAITKAGVLRGGTGGGVSTDVVEIGPGRGRGGGGYYNRIGCTGTTPSLEVKEESKELHIPRKEDMYYTTHTDPWRSLDSALSTTRSSCGVDIGTTPPSSLIDWANRDVGFVHTNASTGLGLSMLFIVKRCFR
ncbi:hypothetical protein BDM02DRAFT_3129211 [Thelephora ganbajun]|uniref:Uncharacterized protein n=1 Tax=Thelephora ganbajun TaxID=370292 RepID=A0ACB6ZF71_THEGA|nr:hypothetical protein BDM02DRAFT_3129211 [Thelephora ganbajun]